MMGWKILPPSMDSPFPISARGLFLAVGAGFMYGAWALWANLGHGAEAGWRAGGTQFFVSFVVTLTITTVMEQVHARLSSRLARMLGAIAASVGTTVALAGANQNFRGVRFGPAPSTVIARPTLSFTRSGSNLVLSWSGPFTLMSATDVAGPYADVSGQTNPYTNNVTSGVQRFFGLRQ